MRPTLLLPSLVLGALLPPPSEAAEPGPPIVVTATRTPTPLAEAALSVSVLDSARLTALQPTTILDALRLVPGVAFARNGGIGGVGSVFIRGADSEQTVALIDGVKVNDPSSPGSGFDFGPLLLGTIQRIEVVRGSQSVLWGSQAIGGVVHMMTAEPGGPLAANARAEGGYRGTANLVANVSGSAGPVAASLGGGWFTTEGISSFSEARGGRERDGFENWGVTGRLLLALAPGLALDLRGFWSDSRIDIDGFPPPAFRFADTPETSRARQFVGHAGVRVDLLEGRLRSRLAGTFTSLDRTNRNPAARPAVTFDGLGRNERVEVQTEADLLPWLGLVAGFEHETSRLRTQSFGGPVSRARATLDGVYGQLTARPASGLVLRGGLRHDRHSEFGGAAVLAASGSLSPDGGRTVLRASWGEGFKAPSLFQLFSDFGNPGLRPERSEAADASVSHALLPGFTLSATLFQRRVRDQIVFISCFQNPIPICSGRPFGTYDNVARTRAEGLEAEVALSPGQGLDLRAGYTHLVARNRQTGRDLPRRPRDLLFATLDWQSGFGLSLGATVTVSGARFDDAANRRRLAGYALTDVRAAFALGRGLELFGRIENLFDEDYETVFQYGTPGRAAYAGLRLRR